MRTKVRDRAAFRDVATKVTVRCPRCSARIALLWPSTNSLGPSWDGPVFGRCDREHMSLFWRTWGCKRAGCGWEKRLDDRHVAAQVAQAVAAEVDAIALGAPITLAT